MMKRFLSFLCCLLVAGAIWLGAPRLLSLGAVTAESDYSAATILRGELTTGKDEMTFRSEGLDESNVFRTLEATWPYACSLHYTIRANGTMHIRVQTENEQEQKQAEVFAAGIVENIITDDMTIYERLVTLHAYLLRHCVYDTQTAQAEDSLQGSGADAPFTAAGALIDGKAVCAGYARAFMMLCEQAGIDVIYISDAEMNHGWTALKLYGKTYYIDPTFDDPSPDRGEDFSMDYFMKTTRELQQTHTWDEAFYGDLLDETFPAQLDPAQRLFDLHMLRRMPDANDIQAPLSKEDRAHLEDLSGETFLPNSTYGDACTQVWRTLCETNLAGTLITRGIFDHSEARQTGIPEECIPS